MKTVTIDIPPELERIIRGIMKPGDAYPEIVKKVLEEGIRIEKQMTEEG